MGASITRSAIRRGFFSPRSIVTKSNLLRRPSLNSTTRTSGQGIRLMYGVIIARMERTDVPNGCLIANSTVECNGSSSRIEHIISESVVMMETCIKAAIDRAIKSEQIPADTNSQQLACFFAAIAQGLAVFHKASNDLGRLHDIVDVAMRSWPNPPKRRAIGV